MNKLISLVVTTLLSISITNSVVAQTLPAGAVFVPAIPSSADNLKLSLPIVCGSVYKGNAYVLFMTQNKITVVRGERVPVIQGGCPPGPREEIDLGKLPPGEYTLTVADAAFPSAGTPSGFLFIDAPFKVTNARFAKQKPWVNLDYSGLWWDPTDSGSGLLIWQDAIDNTFAAWFTYSTDGTPFWYVFQPKWDTAAATFTTDLIQTSRKPEATIPPRNPTTNNTVGTASLDFTNSGTAEEGKFTIMVKGQASRVIKIQRFKP